MDSFFKHLFTETDNVTFDATKVLAALSILTGLGLAIVSVVYKDAPLDMQDYGTGLGLLFAGVGAALGFKKESGGTNS